MKRLQRTVYIFAAISVFVCVAGFIYHRLGRGMFSLYMDHAFYYPLFFGVFFNMLLMAVQSRLPFVGTIGYRLYSNIYNTGIGALTLYSFIMGIMEIAIAESPLIQYLAYFGWLCIAAGLSTLVILLIRSWNVRKRYNRRKQNRH